jgi:hypothetical protein
MRDVNLPAAVRPAPELVEAVFAASVEPVARLDGELASEPIASVSTDLPCTVR